MVEPGLYRHFKGNTYRVLFTARHSETEEPLVIYHPADYPDSLWARPEEMFEEVVDRPEGRGPRFLRVGD
jgi:hypothetical protein